jgi:Methyltransferase domain
MNCKICKEPSNDLFKTLVLNKYSVQYYKCGNCNFIQTESPYWINEAYGSAITSLDIGLAGRNIYVSQFCEWLIKDYFDYNSSFLDYAGGYGLFVRIMRDKGFDFYRQDIYCENLFASRFDISEKSNINHFELVTAFELFEHLEHPIDELKKIFSYTDSILFSTELQPNKALSNVDDWWYFIPETGQHISFYTSKTLKSIAQQFDCHLYSDNRGMHLLTKRNFKHDPFIKYSKYQNDFIIRGLSKARKIYEYIFLGRRKSVKLKSKLGADFNEIRNA